jgi:hypothetical protein
MAAQSSLRAPPGPSQNREKDCRADGQHCDLPAILCANALSGNLIPSNKIFRLNLDLPASRSEKMMGNSQELVPRRCRLNFISIRKA